MFIMKIVIQVNYIFLENFNAKSILLKETLEFNYVYAYNEFDLRLLISTSVLNDDD